MVNMVLGTMDSVPAADMNGDDTINILDIVGLVNIILSEDFQNIGDLNSDLDNNILDVVILIQIILNS